MAFTVRAVLSKTGSFYTDSATGVAQPKVAGFPYWLIWHTDQVTALPAMTCLHTNEVLSLAILGGDEDGTTEGNQMPDLLRGNSDGSAAEAGSLSSLQGVHSGQSGRQQGTGTGDSEN